MHRSGIAVALPLAIAIVALAGCTADPSPAPSAASREDARLADDIRAAVTQQQEDLDLRAVIVRVTRGDHEIVTDAWGESMTGVPATADMHFRNGAIAIPQVSTVLLQLVDEGEVVLDDTIDTWLPQVPHADEVTLGQLAQMTSGYADYLWSEDFLAQLAADPFRHWQPEELYAFGTDEPLVYEPGTNWNYSHTDYVLLGLALERITGDPLDEVIRERILDPLGLENTAAPGTPAMLEPALHALDAERRDHLGIPADVSFVEDSTHWDPSWTLARGAVQNTDVADTATLFRAIGRGELLSDESHERQIAPTLRDQTTAVEGCPSCFPQDERYTFGYGLVLHGDWMLQNPAFHGYGGVAAYLPAQDVSVAVVVTYLPGAFDAEGEVGNGANSVFRAIAEIVAPGSVP
ncbi:beta-lactamase family protein [Microbacterium sp. LRZ72]|uniref:serine hydrolase domain-containing protein n=1 Tax=Microbacterium sp. LRZ72 TaxID=2942481 RepID=UPI0029B7E24F|nr:serine hydrolase domain-containing protein [Microbacterium sp. LRZ72]MDX2376494.1 beta-lactamase family protein [Microbacterium sp. LRZ72]